MPRQISITNTEHSMKTEHTQGPWSFSIEDQGRCVVRSQTTGLPYVAQVLSINARLIAAAPELLEALYAALPCVEESEEFDKPRGPKLSVTIRALLAQAEGKA